MTKDEALDKFRRMGWKVYYKPENKKEHYSIWHGNHHCGHYSTRKMIHFTSCNFNDMNFGYSLPFPSEKPRHRRRSRRVNKQELNSKGEEFEEVVVYKKM